MAVCLAALGLMATSAPPLGLAWLAICALPVGVLGSGLGRAGLLPPLVWCALVGARSPWAALVIAGYLAAGHALGCARPGARLRDAGLALLVLSLLAGLPSLGGLMGHAPWSPPVTSWLLDISPVVLVLESAGVDWLRHPAVYGPAGGDGLGPDLRGAWSGEVAGPVVLLLGCALTALTLRCRATTSP